MRNPPVFPNFTCMKTFFVRRVRIRQPTTAIYLEQAASPQEVFFPFQSRCNLEREHHAAPNGTRKNCGATQSAMSNHDCDVTSSCNFRTNPTPTRPACAEKEGFAGNLPGADAENMACPRLSPKVWVRNSRCLARLCEQRKKISYEAAQ